jgi:hypothetical protein
MANKLPRTTGNLTTAGTWADGSTVGPVLTHTTTQTITTSLSVSPAAAGNNEIVRYTRTKFSARPASPGAETVTFILRNITDTVDAATVTINKSDLPADGDCEICIDWGANITLTTGKNWGLGIKTSAITSGTLSWYVNTSGGNFPLVHFLSTASGAAPTTGDVLFIIGARTGAGALTTRTVTMDQNSANALSDIHISDGATCTWSTGATTLLTTSGSYTIYAGGTHNRGTSGGRVSASFTSTLDLTGATKGLVRKSGCTYNDYGATLTRTYDQLSSTANSGQAHLITVNNNSADWPQWGKLLGTAATTFNATRQHEQSTINSITTTDITCTGNLTNTHTGTNTSGQDQRAHVAMLSRNVITRWNAGTAGYIFNGPTSVVNESFTEITTASSGTFGSATANQRGIDIQTTTGSYSMTDCSIHDTGGATSAAACIVTGAAWNNVTFSRNVIYNHIGTSAIGISTAPTTGTNYTFDSNLLIGISTSSAGSAYVFGDVGGTITNNIANGIGTSTTATATSGGLALNESATFGTISGLVAYCNASSGIGIGSAALTTVGRNSRQTISSCKAWRNQTRGFNLGVSNNNMPIYTLSSCNAWGNGSEIDSTAGTTSTGWLFLNCTFDTGATVTSAEWMFGQAGGVFTGTLVGCSIGQNQAYTTLISAATAQLFQIESYGSSIAFTTLIGTQTSIHLDSYFESFNHNATAGDYRLATKNGSNFNEVSDTTHGEHTTCRALTPNIASNANDDNCEHWMEHRPAFSGTAPQPTFRLKSFSSWNGKAYIAVFFKGQIVSGPTEITSSVNSSTFTNCAITGSDPAENGSFDFRLTYSGTTGGLYLDAEGDAALRTIS